MQIERYKTLIVGSAEQMEQVNVNESIVRHIVLSETVTIGQIIRQDTDGRWILADATADDADVCMTLVAINGGVAGETVRV